MISQKQELALQIQNIELEYKKLLMSDKFTKSNTTPSKKVMSLDNGEYEGMKLQITSLQQYIKDKENEMNTLKEMIKKIKNK